MDYIAGSSQEQAEALQKIGGAAMIVSTASDPTHTGDLLGGLHPKGKLLVLARMFSHRTCAMDAICTDMGR